MSQPTAGTIPVTYSLDGDDWLVHPFLGDEWVHHRAHLPTPVDAARWWPSTVPGSIVSDAVRTGAVPDPYHGLNSRAAEWLADRTLVFRKVVSVPAPVAARRATLVLDGIDYSGGIFCDGIEVGAHQGQFTPFIADITDLVAAGGDHLLAVVVDPAPVSEPQVGWTSRVRIAKTRMSYGWDFCPRLIHQGIWRPARLDLTGPARIADVRVDTELVTTRSSDRRAVESCTVTVSIDLDPAQGDREARGAIRCSASILGPDGAVLATMDAAPLLPQATHVATVEITDPQLWWPNGFGTQPLYRAVASVIVGNRISDERELSFGIRGLRFRRVMGAGAGALPYVPVVNGTPIPVRGWNWVPVDLAYGSANSDRTRRLVALAARTGATVLRVWGGGLIETEEFYDACDREGILVWQEFPLSSSGMESTPAEDDEFVGNLAAGAEHAVRTRRHHPSLAIWCGGNELADGHGNPLTATHPALAALSEVVARMDPSRLFLPTSPSGPAFANEVGGSGEQHDVHGPWEHQGLAEHYARYDGATCQLLSEFGVEGMAYSRVLDHVIGTAAMVMPTRGTELWDHLGKWWNNEALVQRVFGNRISGFDAMSRCSQFLQADGLRYAVQAQRRRWPTCAGAIGWQLNEPFPNAWCTSAVDFTGEPKPAYHYLAAAYAPFHVCAKIERQSFDGEAGFAVDLVVLSDTGPGGEAGGIDACSPDTWCADPVAPAGPKSVTVTAAVCDLYGTMLATRRFVLDLAAGIPTVAGAVRTEFAGAGTSAVMLTVQAVSSCGQFSRTRYLLTAAADFAELLDLPPAQLEVQAELVDGDVDTWCISVRNVGAISAAFIRLRDGRAYGAPGWMLPEDSGFHLAAGETVRVPVHWTAAPTAGRGVTLDAFNQPEMTVMPPACRHIAADKGQA